MAQRRDFLKECHSQVSQQVKEALPLDSFGVAYCSRCLQPECSRSTHGTTRFDQRVANWQERLFLKVPRMDPGDPRFEEISSREFHPVQETLVVQGWGDSDPEPPKSTPPETLTEIVSSGEQEEKPHFQPTPTPSSISHSVLLMNTRVESEQYLSGAPKPPGQSDSAKKKNSWGAPEQSTPSEVVVATGATVRFGSGPGVSK